MKKPNCICGMVIPLSQGTFKLQEYQTIFSSKLRLSLAWHCTGAHYWCLSELSCFVKLHTMGKIVRPRAYWSIGSFLNPYGNHLPFTPALTTKIIAALLLLDVIVAFLSRRRRPVCQGWACLAPTTQYTSHSAVSARISSDYAKYYWYQNMGVCLM